MLLSTLLTRLVEADDTQYQRLFPGALVPAPRGSQLGATISDIAYHAQHLSSVSDVGTLPPSSALYLLAVPCLPSTLDAV